MPVFVNAFGYDANKVINEAINIANENRCSEINTKHIALAILRDVELCEKFCRTTQLDRISFIEGTLLNDIEADGDGLNEEISLSEASRDVGVLFNNLIAIAHENRKEVTKYDLYNALMKTDGTEFYNFMLEHGADLCNVEASIDILENFPALNSVSVNLNVKAIDKQLDPIELREDIINKLIEVLGRRQKGNPCLIGEAGVGKTSIVEGLAQRIVEGNVPNYLKDKKIISVDITTVIAGCRYKGELEDRFKYLINEVTSCGDLILFFDEFHNIATFSGNTDTGISLINMLKPLLTFDDIRIIGATTISEYQKHIEKDSAFERRIQPVFVSEPSIKESIQMVNKISGIYSEYHNADIPYSVIESAVKLSDRYITNRRLPDKAISLIDETAARLKAKSNGKKVNLTVTEIKNTIYSVTGIDVKDIGKSDMEKLANLEKNLKEHIIGQDEAVKEVSKAIKRNKAGIRNKTKPIGTFLFVGPTGVGKTELSKALARLLFGSEKSLIRLDMTEYIEKHTISRLIGSPPGYIGHENGGQLTDAVRLKPYSVILLDEIEKAHPDIFNVFLQIMDDGRLTDGKGVTTDFKNTIIIMTSNAGYGAEINNKTGIGFTSENDNVEKIPNEKVIKELEKTFKPEFLNRLDRVIVFNNLRKPEISKIVRVMLKEITDNLKENNIQVKFRESVVELMSTKGFSKRYGARNVRRKIEELVEDYITDLIISNKLKKGDRIIINANKGVLNHRLEIKEVIEV